jgi:hypothetical protein
MLTCPVSWQEWGGGLLGGGGGDTKTTLSVQREKIRVRYQMPDYITANEDDKNRLSI